jgi:hypothetical protein
MGHVIGLNEDSEFFEFLDLFGGGFGVELFEIFGLLVNFFEILLGDSFWGLG